MVIVARLFRLLSVALLLAVCCSVRGADEIHVATDPVTRCFHITYSVPQSAPDTIYVQCHWSPAGKSEWHVARVTPLVSETALHLVDETLWSSWMRNGQLVEQRAAGLTRTVVFNPYPDAQSVGKVDVDF